MAYYISFLKTLSFRLNKHTIHFFYNEVSILLPCFIQGVWIICQLCACSLFFFFLSSTFFEVSVFVHEKKSRKLSKLTDFLEEKTIIYFCVYLAVCRCLHISSCQVNTLHVRSPQFIPVEWVLWVLCPSQKVGRDYVGLLIPSPRRGRPILGEGSAWSPPSSTLTPKGP